MDGPWAMGPGEDSGADAMSDLVQGADTRTNTVQTEPGFGRFNVENQ
jgi:hypothetical protein